LSTVREGSGADRNERRFSSVVGETGRIQERECSQIRASQAEVDEVVSTRSGSDLVCRKKSRPQRTRE
jgi:hypothetical protein